MIAFSLTRPTRAEAVTALLAIFNYPAWLDMLVSRAEMAYSDAGGVATVQVALWGYDSAIERALREAGVGI